MLLSSFEQNQPNACEDRTKIFYNLLCVTALKIPGIFVKKPRKQEAKNLLNPGNSGSQDPGFQTLLTYRTTILEDGLCQVSAVTLMR